MSSVGGNEAPQVEERSIFKIALISVSGAAIEWYDFFIFATAAALVFPSLFFPDQTPLVATLLSFATFGVAFFARPLGGIIWGHFGDRAGRKKALVAALMTMGVSTTLIGLLPTEAQLGILAPILLVILRFVQGIAVGGQWGGTVLIATESAPDNRKGFYGSFAQVGVPVGVILANTAFLVVLSTTSPEALAAWGWRIPFLASIVLIGIALYAQYRLEDTEAYQRLVRERAQSSGAQEARSTSPIIEAIRNYPKNIALAAGAFIAVNGIGYIFFAYVLSYGTETLGLSLTTMLAAVAIGSVFMIPAVLGGAALSDRFGRRGIYLVGSALLGLWSFPFFWLMNTESAVLVTISLAVGLIFLGMSYGPLGALFSEMFSTKVRYSGASLGYQLGAILGGGLAPIIATSLVAATGTSISVSFYMFAISVITFVSVLLITETYQVDIARATDEEQLMEELGEEQKKPEEREGVQEMPGG